MNSGLTEIAEQTEIKQVLGGAIGTISCTLSLELLRKAEPEVQNDTIFINSPATGISKKYGYIAIPLVVCNGSKAEVISLSC